MHEIRVFVFRQSSIFSVKNAKVRILPNRKSIKSSFKWTKMAMGNYRKMNSSMVVYKMIIFEDYSLHQLHKETFLQISFALHFKLFFFLFSLARLYSFSNKKKNNNNNNNTFFFYSCNLAFGMSSLRIYRSL